MLAIEDVTERKRIQDDLLRSNEELQRFTYVIAHDLRSPVRGALIGLQMLSRSVEGRLDEEGLSLLAESVKSIERLSALTHDLLVWAEPGSAPQQRALVPIKEPLEIALENLQHHIIRTGATITVSELPTLLADRTQLAMVFQNLISNAIKYKREENPRISIDAIKQGANWQFSVSDNGQGFEPKYASTIFEPFRRLHAARCPAAPLS